MLGLSRRRNVKDIVSQPPGYNFVHSPEVLIHKHTGYFIERSDLEAFETGRNCLRAAHELTGVEYLLHQARYDLLRLAEKIRLAIEAGPSDEVEGFFPNGEVNGSKIGQIDILLERREGCIKQLCVTVNLLLGEFPGLKRKVQEAMLQSQADAA